MIKEQEIFKYTDYKKNPEIWAKNLKISKEAIELYIKSDVIDLHTESYVWNRSLGYDMSKRHSKLLSFLVPVMGQVDLPRVIEACMTGIVLDISANPTIKDENKLDFLKKDIKKILSDLEKFPDHFKHVVTYSDYIKAQNEGKIASWISIQGGQAIDNDLSSLDKIPEVHRITLVHLTKSKIGASNIDLKNKNLGISNFGKSFIEKMVDNKIIVDLSHINRKGFFDALNIVPKNIPVVVTHTGIKPVRNLWRNIDDEQIKAIAYRNGTIGIVYSPLYLSKTSITCSVEKIIDHIEYVINLVGDDFVSLGSDYDGLITLPFELKDITYQPILVQKMLNRKWSRERIRKILGLNFLRVIKEIRP